MEETCWEDDWDSAVSVTSVPASTQDSVEAVRITSGVFL